MKTNYSKSNSSTFVSLMALGILCAAMAFLPVALIVEYQAYSSEKLFFALIFSLPCLAVSVTMIFVAFIDLEKPEKLKKVSAAVTLEKELNQLAQIYGCEIADFKYNNTDKSYYYQIVWKNNIIFSRAGKKITKFGALRLLAITLNNSLLPIVKPDFDENRVKMLYQF